MRLNTVDTYRELQPFQSVEELNRSLSAMRSSDAFRELTPAARRVFDVLARYSAKYPGVSFRSKAKIADELGVSRMTVIRACKQLQAAGFIVQHALKRATGDRRQSSNAIVFSVVTPECDTGNVTPKKPQYKPRDKQITRDTEKPRKERKQAIIKDGLAAHLPAVLRHALAPFFNDADALYRAVGVVYRAKASVSADLRIEAYEDAFRQAITGVMSAFKRGKVRNLDAVLYAAIQRTTKALHIRGLFADAIGMDALVR
ncbi:helix-turn-helix domain-containing protein [Bhargavaea ginsengi]|uniref:helix-turn-helix domain-containing protein n=1 Tax=Bhargavaea ginsengi TaxID=426757 RepID=UPI00203E929C|nr:helix-turn-helix domain-containing protein [Bhargavaea ginsengi]MCM3087125.1 helix-turn-helix domain-containing protein [Bhargavaea ginsengi]